MFILVGCQIIAVGPNLISALWIWIYEDAVPSWAKEPHQNLWVQCLQSHRVLWHISIHSFWIPFFHPLSSALHCKSANCMMTTSVRSSVDDYWKDDSFRAHLAQMLVCIWRQEPEFLNTFSSLITLLRKLQATSQHHSLL